MQKSNARHAAGSRRIDDSADLGPDHSFREYISAMARQLAELARSDGEGDEALATVLEQAAQMAMTPRNAMVSATPVPPEAISHARQG